MAFSNWTFLTGSANYFAHLSEPGFPDSLSEGTGALIIHNTTGTLGGGVVGYVNTSTDSFLQLGLLKGSIRSLFRRGDDASVVDHFAGLFCMASDLNAHNTGQLYGLHVELMASNNIQLRKGSSGGVLGVGTVGTQLGSTFTADFQGAGSIVALELSWNAEEQSSLGGTELVVRMGFEQDFSDLVTIINVVDTTSPLTTSVAEGIWTSYISFGLETFVHLDQTRIEVIA